MTTTEPVTIVPPTVVYFRRNDGADDGWQTYTFQNATDERHVSEVLRTFVANNPDLRIGVSVHGSDLVPLGRCW